MARIKGKGNVAASNVPSMVEAVSSNHMIAESAPSESVKNEEVAVTMVLDDPEELHKKEAETKDGLDEAEEVDENEETKDGSDESFPDKKEETKSGPDVSEEDETEDCLVKSEKNKTEESKDDFYEPEEIDEMKESEVGLDNEDEDGKKETENAVFESEEGAQDAKEDEKVVPMGTDVPEGEKVEKGVVRGTDVSEGEKVEEGAVIKEVKDLGKEANTPKKKAKRIRKEKKRVASNGADKSSGADKQGTSAAVKKDMKMADNMGLIFMCNAKTKMDCFRYKVFGLPASKKEMVAKINKDMRLFLFDIDLKLLYGIYKAASPGGYNIEPKAFKSGFPSQVRFHVLNDCLPLPEEKFKAAIKGNYYGRNKFNCELSPEQVKDLCKLFQSEGKTINKKRPKEVVRAETEQISSSQGWKRARHERARRDEKKETKTGPDVSEEEENEDCPVESEENKAEESKDDFYESEEIDEMDESEDGLDNSEDEDAKEETENAVFESEEGAQDAKEDEKVVPMGTDVSDGEKVEEGAVMGTDVPGGETVEEGAAVKEVKDLGKEENTPKKKAKRIRKKKKKVASIGADKSSGADKQGTSVTVGTSAAVKKDMKMVDNMGLIFMCNAKTKMDCFRYKVFGLPASKKEMVAKIYKGMRLFLFDVDLKLLYGIYKAASPGGYNIEPKAFKSGFPSQVRFHVLNDCLPLPEEKFKAAIKGNYYGRNKFNCELSPEQVKDLCKIFQSEGKTINKKNPAETKQISSSQGWKRARLEREKPPRALALPPPPLPQAPYAMPPPPLPQAPYAYGRSVDDCYYRREAPVLDPRDHRGVYLETRPVDPLGYRDPYSLYREPLYRDPVCVEPPSREARYREPLSREAGHREPVWYQETLYPTSSTFAAAPTPYYRY